MDLAACTSDNPPRSCKLTAWQKLLEDRISQNTSLMEITRFRRYEAEALAHALADCDAATFAESDVTQAKCQSSARYFTIVREGAPTPSTRLMLSMLAEWSWQKMARSMRRPSSTDDLVWTTAAGELRDKWSIAIGKRLAELEPR
jgi:hypothetical protein